VSIAIEHARAYEAERRVVEELQRSLLPERLPEVEEVRMAVRYLPAEAAARVGGDWYDAIELPGRRLGLVIGDVVGHGAPAAAMMGELRNSLRAFASEGHLPDAALTRLEAFTTASHGPQMLATLLFMVFEIDTGSATFASAGHLPPLLLLPDGSASYCEQRISPPLGVCHQRGFEHSTVKVPDGATLILFTDGLVERRGEAIDTGLERLRGAVMEASGGLEDLCSNVLAITQAGHRSRDDLALLAVRVEPLPTTGWTVRMPAAADSVPLLRHRLKRWLDQLGVPAGEQFPLALAVTEAAANAVEHAYGPGEHEFEVTVRVEGEAAMLRIRDYGRWQPPQRNANRGRGLRLIEQLTDELSIRRGRDGTTVRVRHRLPVTPPE
jgi:anti-sigma regulatory factor (Ser/Thr protein kinase)